MRIIACPKCGVKNSLPEAIDSKRKYRCGRCGTMLPTVKQHPTTEDEAAVFVPPQSDLQEGTLRSKPASPPFLPTNVVGWFKIRENRLIFLLVLFALVLHLATVSYLPKLFFDEHYYVPEARSIIQGTGIQYPEHPAVAKLLIATGIRTLGDNPWGWRIPSVIFGVVSVMLFYLICQRLTRKSVALLASFLLVFDSLTFVMSGVAMLDVFSLTFMLLAFLLYLNNRYASSGMSLALSALCKMTGILGIFVILGHWLIQRKRRSLRDIAILVFVSFAGFMLFLPVSDFLATGYWVSPISRISQMLRLSSTNTFAQAVANAAAHPGLFSPPTYPWEWILRVPRMTFSAGSTPKASFVITMDPTLWILNPTLWILIVPSMGYMFYEFMKRKTEVSLFVILWFAATYLLWIPAVILTDRLTYGYYFYPTVGAVCLGVGFVIMRLWDFASKSPSLLHRWLIKSTIIGYLALNVILFVAFASTLWSSSITPI